MTEQKDDKVVINFTCPYCNKEVQENDLVFFDEVEARFAHIECMTKDREEKENGSKSNDN